AARKARASGYSLGSARKSPDRAGRCRVRGSTVPARSPCCPGRHPAGGRLQPLTFHSSPFSRCHMHLANSHRRMPVLGSVLALGGSGVSQSRSAVVDRPGPARRAGATKVRDAIKVLDLRTIPKLDLDRLYSESATYATYTGRSNLAAAV